MNFDNKIDVNEVTPNQPSKYLHKETRYKNKQIIKFANFICNRVSSNIEIIKWIKNFYSAHTLRNHWHHVCHCWQGKHKTQKNLRQYNWPSKNLNDKETCLINICINKTKDLNNFIFFVRYSFASKPATLFVYFTKLS